MSTYNFKRNNSNSSNQNNFSNNLRSKISSLSNSVEQIDEKIDNIAKKLKNDTTMGETYSFAGFNNMDKMAAYFEALKKMDPEGYYIKKYIIDENIKNTNDKLYSNTNYIRDNQTDEEMNHFKIANQDYGKYRSKCINYIAAILDPEYNFNTGLQVKQPSLLNPPSVSISFRTLATIQSDQFNSICISWNPSIFCNAKYLNRIQLGVDKTNNDAPIYANKICSVLYSLGKLSGNRLDVPPSGWNSPVYGIPDNLPDVGVSKARLVSSKIKISFRGAVLNQGGTIMGCATFQGPPAIITSSQDISKLPLLAPDQHQLTWGEIFKKSNNTLNTELDLSPFEEKIISNGIWSKNINITKNANGISAVFIPTDPMDEIFYKPATYYGETIQNTNDQCNGPNNTIAISSEKGAHLNYLFNIQGIPNGNTDPIVVETFTTWEILPTNESVSSLRNFSQNINSLNVTEVEMVKDVMKEYFMDENSISSLRADNDMSGFVDKIKNLYNKVSGAVKKLV